MTDKQDSVTPKASGNQADNLSDIAFKLPARVPFEQHFSQVFMEGLQTRGTFIDSQLAKVGDDVKQLEYSIEYQFVPEKKNPGTKPNERAFITLHFRASVTDLAKNSEAAR